MYGSLFLHNPVSRFILILIIIGGMTFAAQPARSAGGVVGTGTPGSCTDTSFDTVFNNVQSSGGGIITFNCGAAPHTIILSVKRSVSANTEIHGSNLVSLSGGNTTPLFQVYAGRSFTLKDITLTRAAGTSGGVENFGDLIAINSQFLNNSSQNSGGAILTYGDVSLTNTVISNNTADQYGGGIHAEGGNITITNSQFTGNSADLGGAGLQISSFATVTITGSQFTSNKLPIAPSTEGGGIRTFGTLIVSDTQFSENHALAGGAIFIKAGSTSFSRSVFRSNGAIVGSGLRQSGGNLKLTDVTIDGNEDPTHGANGSSLGGGIYSNGGAIELSNVTLSNNKATHGGGFYTLATTISMVNSTISGNTAKTSSGGFYQQSGNLTLTNVTIAGNTAPSFGGGIVNIGGTLTLKNVVLSGNFDSDNNQKYNCYQAIPTATFSLSDDSTCGFGAGRDNANLPLRPLYANGGFSLTHLPRPGNDAIDGGTGAGCPVTDQRGIARPQSSACDAGSVEVKPADLLNKIFLPLMKK